MGIGATIAIVAEIVGIPSLAFSVGIYLPVWFKYSKAQRVSSLHLPKGHLNPPSRSDTYSSSVEGVASWLRAACAFYLFIRAHELD